MRATGAAKLLGELKRSLRGTPRSSDPHSAALLTHSDAIARSRGAVDEVALKTARAAGLTDAEISEVVGPLALNILTTRPRLTA
ncbi:hypothetical protein [Kribbella sp. NBC_00889]|uniref:hypothetical protein n=1 Tax=Kribbella sp. NBC_00889 TaxID=2975974 RepID=UPI003866C4E0|nr:hypothetical protein OG817_12890 [Kribbella sp. NBC_00889]